MAAFMGWEQYLAIQKESTWGTFASSTDVFIPYTEYSVRPVVQSAQGALFTGVRQRKANRILRATLTGNLACPLFGYHTNSKSVAEHLIEWALSGPASSTLESWSGQLNNPNEDKRHLGLRVASMTLAGDASSGIVTISLSLQGYQETAASAPALSATLPQPVEALFSDVEFFLADGDAGESATSAGNAVSLRSFNLTVNNNLQVYHTNSYWPSQVPAGVREVSFNFEVFNTANTYDALRRATDVTNRAAALRMTIPHLGTTSGDNTVVSCYFDKLNFANATDQAALNELATQSVEWIALKPSTSENDIEFAYSTS